MLVLLRGCVCVCVCVCVWVKVTNQATTTFTRPQELPFRTWKTTRLNGGSKCPVGFVSKNHHLIVMMICKLWISTTKLFFTKLQPLRHRSHQQPDSRQRQQPQPQQQHNRWYIYNTLTNLKKPWLIYLSGSFLFVQELPATSIARVQPVKWKGNLAFFITINLKMCEGQD